MTMHPTNLTAGAARLREALETLEIAWDETKLHWDDPSSRNFDENHLQPIGPQVRAALDAISRMQQIVASAQRDCEASP